MSSLTGGKNRTGTRGAAATVVVLCLAGLTTSCDYFQFGDQARSFVDNDARSTSKRLVEAEFAKRWPDFYRVSATDLALRLSSDVNHIPDIVSFEYKSRSLGKTDWALAALMYASANLETVRRIEQDLFEALTKTETLQNVCSNHEVYDQMGLDTLRLIGPLGSLRIPHRSMELFIKISLGEGSHSAQDDPDLWITIANSIASLWGDDQYQKQLDKFNSALSDYPKRVIPATESFSLSTRYCQDTLTRISPMLTSLTVNLKKYLVVARLTEGFLVEITQTANAIESPDEVGQSIDRMGLAETFKQWREQQLFGRLLQDLGVALAEVRSLRVSIDSERSCSASLFGVEEYSAAVIDARESAEIWQQIIDRDA